MEWILALKNAVAILVPFIGLSNQIAENSCNIELQKLKTFHRKFGKKFGVGMNMEIYKILKKISLEFNDSSCLEYYDYMKFLSDSYVMYVDNKISSTIDCIKKESFEEVMGEIMVRNTKMSNNTSDEYEYYSEIVKNCASEAYLEIATSGVISELGKIAHYSESTNKNKIIEWDNNVEEIKMELNRKTILLFHEKHFSASVIYSNSSVSMKLSGYGTVRSNSKVTSAIFDAFTGMANRTFTSSELINIVIPKGNSPLYFTIPYDVIRKVTIVDLTDVEYIYTSIGSALSLIEYVKKAYGENEEEIPKIKIIVNREQFYDLGSLSDVSTDVFEVEVV